MVEIVKLGYDKDPTKLQLLIRKIFEDATCKIEIEGTTVVPFPLFKVLDGKDTNDYAQRVEPSVQGGSKIGKALAEKIIEVYNSSGMDINSKNVLGPLFGRRPIKNNIFSLTSFKLL